MNDWDKIQEINQTMDGMMMTFSECRELLHSIKTNLDKINVVL